MARSCSQSVKVELANLGGNILGQEVPGLIEINATAAGFSWNVNAGNPAATQVDLRTVLEHEMGHVLGLPDNARAGDLMDIGLGLGGYRAPTETDVTALDRALRAAVALSNNDALAAILSASRITGAGSSPAQFNSAVEMILAESVPSTGTGPLLQPSASGGGRR